MVDGYVLVDITLRMLQPPELKLAQGFGPAYHGLSSTEACSSTR